MSIDAWYSYYELKKLERRTFEFLKKEPHVIAHFGDLYYKAGNQYDLISNDNLLGRTDINFESKFELKCREDEYRIHIGAEVRSNHSVYFIAVCCKKDGIWKILRKFHFDYDKNGRERDHPIFHLQYAGELSSALSEYNDHYDNILNPWLSEPRLFYPPVTLALLINTVLKEFQTDITSELLNNDRWRGIIKDNEIFAFKSYFEKCLSFLNSAEHKPSKKLFLTDYCYGK